VLAKKRCAFVYLPGYYFIELVSKVDVLQLLEDAHESNVGGLTEVEAPITASNTVMEHQPSEQEQQAQINILKVVTDEKTKLPIF
jgi:hypothetical protein